MTEQHYESPSLTEIGSLHDLTQFDLNVTKNAGAADVLSGINVPGVGVVPNGSIATP